MNLTMLLLLARGKWWSLAVRAPWRWPWCGGAWPRSGLAWPAFAVASTLEHLWLVGKKEHALGKAEVHGAVLATASRRVDERRRDLTVAEMAMCPLPWLGYSKWKVNKVCEVVALLWTW
jgi:hypothetical protein